MKNVPMFSNIPNKENSIHRSDWLIALSLGILVVLLGCALMVEGVAGFYYDDGIYLITAKAMAQGDGYRLIHLPDSPLQTKYPILYPAILAVIWKIYPLFPSNLFLMQWISLLFGAVTSGLAYLYLFRFGYCSRTLSAAAVSLCATSPFYLFLCTSCLSEIPFAFCLILAMWALEKHLETPFSSKNAQFLIGVFLALPFLFRSIGIVSLFAVLILAFRNKKIMYWPIIGAASTSFPYIAWLLMFSNRTSASSSYMTYTNYVNWWQNNGIHFLDRVLISNSFVICFGSSPISQSSYLSTLDSLSLIAVLLGLAGLIMIIRQLFQWKVLPIIISGYLAIVIIWPWPPQRFLIPILPFLLVYSITAVVGISKCLPQAFRYVGFVLLGILLTANANAVLKDISVSRDNHYPAHMFKPRGVVSNWSHYEEMFQWIKRHSNPDDLFATGMDPMLYLYTERSVIRPFAEKPASMFYQDTAPPIGSLEEIMGNIQSYKPQYLALFPMPRFGAEIPYTQFIVESQKKYPGWLKRVYIGKDERFVIWKIVSNFSDSH